MSRVTVRIRGLAECQAKMREVVSKIEAGTETALDVVADATLADDQAGCPVDTGNLRDNQAIFAARLTRQIGSDVPYHIFVNNGTYKMAARPFTTNAFEANQGKLVPECQKIQVV